MTFVVQMLAFNEPKLVVTGLKNTAITNAEAVSTTDGTNFGTVTVGKSSATETFTISNAGNAALDFTSTPWVVISGTDAGDFTLTQPVIGTNSATFTILFKPTAKGLRTATITIPTNDPTYPNFSFPIEGTGG
jgi:phage-related protein